MIARAKRHRRVECIGKAILEEPGQFRIGNRPFDLDDLRFDSFANKLPLRRSRARALEVTLR